MPPEDFEHRWTDLVSRYELKDNVYIERLFANRNMWAKPYFLGVFCAGMTSTQRSESANSLLKQYITRSSPMHLFVQQYNNLLSSRVADEGREEHATLQRRRICTSTTPIEANAAQIYTRAMFEMFKEELYLSGSYVVNDGGDRKTFLVTLAPTEHAQSEVAKRYVVSIEDAVPTRAEGTGA